MHHKILNNPTWNSPFLKGKDICLVFADALNIVCKKFYHLKQNRLDYSALASSEEYTHLVRLSHALPLFNLSQLDSRTDQLAFWLNIYNTMVLHIVISENLKGSPQDISGFYDRYQYKIGDFLFSLDDIEHGILRANQRKYMAFSTPMTNKDPRLEWRISRIDPRVHFAFACAALSSPPLKAFYREHINQQLDETTSLYLDQKITLNRSQKKLHIPKLFKWYKKDFGKDQDIVNFIGNHLADTETQAFLFANKQKINFAYLDFDWQLNTTNEGT